MVQRVETPAAWHPRGREQSTRNWHDERFDDSLKGMTAARSLRVLLLPLLVAAALALCPAAARPSLDAATPRRSLQGARRTSCPPAAASGAPQRIVLAGRAVALVADAVYAFPAARGLVVASASTDQGLGNFHELVDPLLPSRPALDRQAGPETIAALKPDLVLFKSSMAAVLQAPLEALGIAARGLSLETPEDWTEEILRLGEWLGAVDRGREVAAYFRSTYEAVRAQAGAAAARPTVLVLYVSAAAGDAFNVPPAAWMQTRMAVTAGGTPVWAGANPGSGWARVSFEQIAAWNPDFIAVASYAADSSAAAAGLRADPRFKALAAGKSGRILAFPQDFYSWDQSGSRWILGLVWLARQLHPERFPPGAVIEEARRFYRTLYGFSEERFDALVRPRLKGDYAR
jgi:iron complex transport system substrate-binding protein